MRAARGRPCARRSEPARPSGDALRPGLSATLLGLSAALLGSCAGLPRPVEAPEPLALLDAGAPLYLRLDGEAVRELAPLIIEAEALDQARPLLRGLELAALALRPRDPGAQETEPSVGAISADAAGVADATGAPPAPASAGAAQAAQAAAPLGATLPPFEAVLLGDYPKGRLEFGLFFARGWRRFGAEHRNEAQGIALTLPRDGLLFARSLGAEGKAEPAPETLSAPGSVPPWLAELLERRSPGILAWLPSPLSAGGLLSGGAGGRSMAAGWGAPGLELPIEDLLVLGLEAGGGPSAAPTAARAEGSGTATQAEAAPRRYRLALVARMRDERSARLFRPALSLAYYALSRGLPALAGLPPPSFKAEGAFIVGEGAELDAEGLARLLRALL